MIERDIRINLWNYLSGKSSLSVFKEWFVPATWDVERAESAENVGLVNEVKLCLAEHSSGHLGDAELKSYLVDLLVPTREQRCVFTEANVVSPLASSGVPMPYYDLRANPNVGDDLNIAEVEYEVAA